MKRSTDLFPGFYLTGEPFKWAASQGLLVFLYLVIVLYVSNTIENVFICYIHVLGLLFRFCFKIGRGITFSGRLVNGFIYLILGLVISIVYFNWNVTSYTYSNAILSIIAAILSGIFWLTNKEDTSEVNLTFWFFMLSIWATLFSFVSLILLGGF